MNNKRYSICRCYSDCKNDKGERCPLALKNADCLKWNMRVMLCEAENKDLLEVDI